LCSVVWGSLSVLPLGEERDGVKSIKIILPATRGT